MTLVVYKNNILAADKRQSTFCGHQKSGRCANCGEKSTSVNDSVFKIRLGTKNSKFRGQAVLAYSAAGDAELLRRISGLVSHGANIEEAYETYLKIAGPAERNTSCTLMLICETKSYIVVVPGKGPLHIDEYERDQPLYIGSGSRAAQALDKALDPTPAELINMVMAVDKGVGGDVEYIDLSANGSRDIINVKTTPPDALMADTQLSYKKGQAVREQERKAQFAKDNIIKATPVKVRKSRAKPK